MEIRIGRGTLTVHRDDEVLVSEPDGSVHGHRQQGYLCADTRLVSDYGLRLGQAAPVLVSSAAASAVGVRYELVNDDVVTPEGPLSRGLVHCRIDRVIGGGVHEDLELTSYADHPVTVELDLDVRCDFVDLADLRRRRFLRRGRLTTEVLDDGARVVTRYRGDGFERAVVVRVEQAATAPEYANGRLAFRCRLEPRRTWHACLLWVPVIDGQPRQPVAACHALADGGDDSAGNRTVVSAQVRVEEPGIDQVVSQALEDLGSLRLRGSGVEGVPAAGVPWFATLFGRDPLWVALQTTALGSELAVATLEALAESQATRRDDCHDSQPGKIQHEVRHGELAARHLIPQTPYYGTHDATSLYVLAAAELWRWTGDRELLARFRPHVERALAWVDHSGDLDGDGLQEYESVAGRWGSYNLGWKDSDEAVVDGHGQRAELPLALCELQGYVVAAKRRWAAVAEEAFEDGATARRLRREADRLATLIEERLWWEAEGTYYFGLDGRKRPITSVVSNPGHLLWSGAVDQGRAARVAERLLAEDLFSGWGLRTLSSAHPAFNPFSYQRGSVWPHDTAITIAGLARYGRREAAWRLTRGLLDAAVRFEHHRLPEVFAGLARDEAGVPVRYVGANVPQAWASGAAVHVLTTLAGLHPDAGRRSLRVRPLLPAWFGTVELRGLAVGPDRVDVTMWANRAWVSGRAGGLVTDVPDGERNDLNGGAGASRGLGVPIAGNPKRDATMTHPRHDAPADFDLTGQADRVVSTALTTEPAAAGEAPAPRPYQHRPPVRGPGDDIAAEHTGLDDVAPGTGEPPERCV